MKVCIRSERTLEFIFLVIPRSRSKSGFLHNLLIFVYFFRLFFIIFFPVTPGWKLEQVLDNYKQYLGALKLLVMKITQLETFGTFRFHQQHLGRSSKLGFVILSKELELLKGCKY